jgi:hypothetical protein
MTNVNQDDVFGIVSLQVLLTGVYLKCILIKDNMFSEIKVIFNI